jgi:hypothetical protein
VDSNLFLICNYVFELLYMHIILIKR